MTMNESTSSQMKRFHSGGGAAQDGETDSVETATSECVEGRVREWEGVGDDESSGSC